MSKKPIKLGKIIFKSKTKKGNDLIIRYPKWDDLDDLLNFANAISKEDTFVLLSGEQLTRDEEIDYLANQISAMERGRKIHIVAQINGEFAANCGIDFFERRKSHVGEIHISVAKKFRDEGIGLELMNVLIKEAKKTKLKLLMLTCFEENKRAIYLYKKLGFRQFGALPKAYKYKNNYHTEIYMYYPLEISDK